MVSSTGGTSTSISNWLQGLEQLIRLLGTLWNSKQVARLRSEFMSGTRRRANIRGAILTGFTYVSQAAIFKDLGLNVKPTELTQGSFVIKLYAERPGRPYRASYFKVSTSNSNYAFLSNIYSGSGSLNLNLDIALIELRAWQGINKVTKRSVVFFTECKYGKITTQTYATAAGQRYFVKSGSNYINARDLLVSAKEASTTLLNTAEYIIRSLNGLTPYRPRKYDPILIINLRPTNNTYYQELKEKIRNFVINRVNI